MGFFFPQFVLLPSNTRKLHVDRVSFYGVEFVYQGRWTVAAIHCLRQHVMVQLWHYDSFK